MPDVSNDVNRELIIALAARYSVPAVYFNRFFSDSLMVTFAANSFAWRHASSRARSRPTFHCKRRL